MSYDYIRLVSVEDSRRFIQKLIKEYMNGQWEDSQIKTIMSMMRLLIDCQKFSEALEKEELFDQIQEFTKTLEKAKK